MRLYFSEWMERSGTLVDRYESRPPLVLEIPNVLDWVASFRVVVKCWSRDFIFWNSHSRIASEGIGDLLSRLFWSATELQLSLFNLSLDQLIEDPDVGELFDPPSNSCSEATWINFVVRAIFVQGTRVWTASVRDGTSTWVSSAPDLSVDCI